MAEVFYDVSVSSSSVVNIAAGFSVSVTGSISNSGTLDNDGIMQFSGGYAGQSGILSGDGKHVLTGGDWDVSAGVFTAENSTVEMKGNTAQTIQGGELHLII